MFLFFLYSPILFGDLDPLVGGSGWTGAGILGLVLGWLLLVHLPGKDKLIQGLIDKHSLAIQSLMDRNDKSQKSQQDSFSAALSTITDHCKDEMERMLSYLQEGRK